MKKILIALAVFCLGVSYAYADFNMADWQFKKTIAAPFLESPAYVQVNLDRDVSRMRTDFRDVRIIRDTGTEVPYQLVKLDSGVADNFYPATVLNKSSNKAGETSFELDLGAPGILHNRISISTNAPNFRRNVSVYVREKKANEWELVTNKGYIYSYTDTTAGVHVTGTDVGYSQNTKRYVKVVVAGGEEGPLLIQNAQIFRYEVSSARENVVTVPVEVVENATERTTEITADLGVVGFPTTLIELTPKSTINYSRTVTLEGSDDKINWHRLSSGYVFNITTALYTGGNSIMSYPESMSRYIRAVIWNQDNAPVTFGNEATLRGVARIVVFEATPDQSYSLYYGNAAAREPHYDLAKFFQYLEVTEMKEALLSPESVNASFKAPFVKPKPLSDRTPYLLPSILVLLVLLIGGAVAYFIYKNRNALRPPTTPTSDVPSTTEAPKDNVGQ